MHVIEKKFVFVLFGSFGFLYAKRACQIKCKVYVTVWRLKKKNALKKLRFDVKRAAQNREPQKKRLETVDRWNIKSKYLNVN